MNKDKSLLAQMFGKWKLEKQLTYKELADIIHVKPSEISNYQQDYILSADVRHTITSYFINELLDEKIAKEHKPNLEITEGVFIDTEEDIRTMHGYLNSDDD